MANNETVEYDIILQAQEAIRVLAELTASTSTFDAKIKQVSASVVQLSKMWGTSLGSTRSLLQEYDKALSSTGKDSAIFGEMGKQGWNDVGKAVDKTTEKVGGFKRSIDVLRIALGTLIAMGVFQFFNFLSESFRKTIEGAKQLELAFYQLGNAEKSLSKAGVEITPQDFDAMIKGLKELFPYLSKIDLTRLVSQVSLLTKDLGLTKDQIEGLVRAIPIMAQRGQITIEQATQQVVNGLANNGRGWKDLGIVVDAAVIKQEAVTAGLVESADAYNRLTAEQKQQVDVLALLSILNKSVSDEQKNQAEYQKTLDENLKQASATWEDLLATLGKVASPFLITFLKELNRELTFTLNIINLLKPAFLTWIDELILAANASGGIIGAFAGLNTKLAELRAEVARSLTDTLGTDTPTAINQKLTITPEIDKEKLDKEIKDLLKDLQDLSDKEVRINAEFNKKQMREANDHVTDMSRAEEDYQIKRSRFIQDSNQSIADKNQKYHQQELDDEAKFQEQLRQLRERFLFDLEDALRERDARQVLRLQEKYRMDKQDLINEHNLKQKSDAQQHADDIAQAKKDAADKLAQMDADHKLEMQRKEEDYRLKRARELEDHMQELADLETQRQARIQEAARTIADELGLKEDGAKALYEMLNAWYGSGGAFDNLFDASNAEMIAKTEQMIANLLALYAQASQAAAAAISAVGMGTNTGGGRTNTSNQGQTNRPGKAYSGAGRSGNMHPQAKGGTYLATSATRTTFGEAGPELATFIPLGRSGASVGQTGALGSQSAGGKIDIQLLLSPDLEARIVSNTLSKTADVVLSVVESK